MAKATKSSIELTDVNRELYKAISTGTVLIGSKETIKACKGGAAKVIIRASNCPTAIERAFEAAGGKGEAEQLVYEYPANSLELGLACGKPYAVASLCITEPGDSEILRLLNPVLHPKEKGLNITLR
jgi:large subunit ribosomal protein L30e